MTSVFRDIGNLPFIGRRSERNVFKASILLYLLVGTVFVMSCILYYTANSLKKEVTTISVTPIPEQPCQMLAGVNTKTTLISNMIVFSPCSYTLGQINSVNLVQNGYFANFADCQKIANFQVLSVDNAKGSFVTSTGPDRIVTVEFPIMAPGSCSFTTESLYTLITTQVPNINELICKPWADNPPFQCTTFETLSFLSIISQSFAISSGVFTALVYITKLVLQTSWRYEGEGDAGAVTAELTKKEASAPGNAL